MATRYSLRKLTTALLAASLPWLAGCPAPGSGAAPPECASEFQDAVDEAHRHHRAASDALERVADRAHPEATALREAADLLTAACERALDRSDGDAAALDSSPAVSRAREAYTLAYQRAGRALGEADDAVRRLLAPAMAAAAEADALPVDGPCARVDAGTAYQFKASWLAATTRLASLREGYRRVSGPTEVIDVALGNWRRDNPTDDTREEEAPVTASLPRVLGYVYGRVVRTEAHLSPIVEVYEGEDLDPADEVRFDELSCTVPGPDGRPLAAEYLLESRECEIRLPILEGQDPDEAITAVRHYLDTCAAEATPEPPVEPEILDCDPPYCPGVESEEETEVPAE